MSEYICDFPSNEINDLVMHERVVRCKDCESYQPSMYKHFTCDCLYRWARPDDFCSWATRKERIES